MTEAPKNPPEMPDFGDFYKAVNDRAPFPWQARLACQISQDNSWPEEIGVPTGLGKTACLDIAVWWLASQAHLHPLARSAPTRIWWVVNRRLLVDEASRHAQKLSKMLRSAGQVERPSRDQEVLRRVGARLASLADPENSEWLQGHDSGVHGPLDGSLASLSTAEPLHVIPMRGGLTLRRPPNPAQPSVIVSTIPMYGSRLLFRGFGSSRSMRPIDAALAGTDSLVLVDEAHLARHLRDLVPKLQQCVPESAERVLPAQRSGPQVVSLTATGDASPSGRFDLDDDDLANEVIRQRLDAAKPVEVDAEPRGDSAKALRDAAVRLLKDAASPAACVIFCNTPAVARDVYSLVKSHKLGAAADVMLVTGRTRQHEADALRKRLLDPATGAPAGRTDNGGAPPRERHLIVIATQTLEVGADLDFEYLVTEQCGVRALTQRLGRLNRLGRHDHAQAVYVHRPPKRTQSARDNPGDGARNGWAVYGSEPSVVLERLENRGFEEHIDLSPGVIADRLGRPAEDSGRAPEVLPGLLWEWVKTTTPPHGEAPVEPYFSGIADPKRAVSVVWRAFVPSLDEPARDAVPDESDEYEAADGRYHLWPRVTNDETVEVPVHELQRALRERGVEPVVRRSEDRSFVEAARNSDLRSGDLVVLPIDVGLYDDFGWAPDGRRGVSDLSIQRSGLPLDQLALERLCRNETDRLEPIRNALRQVLPDAEEEVDEAIAREAAEVLISLLCDCDMAGLEPDDRAAFLDALDPSPMFAPNEVPRLELSTSALSFRLDDSDEGCLCESLPPHARELVAHGRAVGERARSIATALGLPTHLVEVIEQAGEFHDVGKADERFQRWLNRGKPVHESDYVPLAKSDMAASRWATARKDAGWPFGGRHEELSARLVGAWLAEGGHGLEPSGQDLLIHLVVSHHGKGRPLVVPVADGSAGRVDWKFSDGSAKRVSADLSTTDWGQPARFQRLNEQFGPWGVALLETIVRQADHEVSASRNEVQ